LGSVLQKSVPAEADGAVHITPAAKAAAAAPTVALKTLVFMLGFLFSSKTTALVAAGYSANSICSITLTRAARFFSSRVRLLSSQLQWRSHGRQPTGSRILVIERNGVIEVSHRRCAHLMV
jgi:hypothetical protein